MPDNTWTHVAGVADGTNIKLYINGVLQTDTDTYSSNLLHQLQTYFLQLKDLLVRIHLMDSYQTVLDGILA